jgi:hypothetical protein
VRGFEANLGGFGVRIWIDAEVRSVQNETATSAQDRLEPRADSRLAHTIINVFMHRPRV